MNLIYFDNRLNEKSIPMGWVKTIFREAKHFLRMGHPAADFHKYKSFPQMHKPVASALLRCLQNDPEYKLQYCSDSGLIECEKFERSFDSVQLYSRVR